MEELNIKPRGYQLTISNTCKETDCIVILPTGTGKTLLARTLARILNIPFAIVDASVLTEAGYVGEYVENVLVLILMNFMSKFDFLISSIDQLFFCSLS